MDTQKSRGIRNPTASHSPKAEAETLMVLGDGDTGGAYVLRIAVARNLRIRFGRFADGRRIAVPQGIFVYVGSAMGSDRGLGRRLARHASRGNGRPHGIRQVVVDAFGSMCLPNGGKRLRWHIDFLMERREVVLTHTIAVRSENRQEEPIADLLMADSGTQVVSAGLGASDAPGRTHLLHAPAHLAWWRGLAEQLTAFA